MKVIVIIAVAVAVAVAVAGSASGAEAVRFDFGARGVGVTNLYSHERGYGFERGGKVTQRESFVTSEGPFLFSIKLEEGNYTVKVALGDEAGESSTTVKAEARRLMLESVRTAKGEIVSREFSLNIRTPRIDGGGAVRLKQREKEAEQVTWDDKLTLEFNGSRPCLRSIEIVAGPAMPTVFIAGDSTVCDQPDEPWNSWGQMITRFFGPGVAVANYAQSGESIKSSMGARRFEKIFSTMKRGDWLLMQFGHNDMKDRGPEALAAYEMNLRAIVRRVQAKGGTPVLVTSMERKAGVVAPTLGAYPDAVRRVAKEDSVALIDLHARSLELYKALGRDLERAFQDGSHHNAYGSYELAKCVASGIAAAKLDLEKYLIEDVKSFNPARPDSVASFNVPPSRTLSERKPDGN